MPALFSALAAIYTSAAQIAAALGISRQAYSQASKRRHLSERAAIRAAALLKIDPAAALLSNATPENSPLPVSDAAPELVSKRLNITPEKDALTTNYAQLADPKKSASITAMRKNVHVIPQSKKRLFEIDCVRWMLAVPKISPDSPRFVQYFSRWVVPEKIARAKAAGTFEETTKTCTSFAPDLCSFIAAGFAEYLRFTGQPPEQPELSSTTTPTAISKPRSYFYAPISRIYRS